MSVGASIVVAGVGDVSHVLKNTFDNVFYPR